jgi:hypothetical protein
LNGEISRKIQCRSSAAEEVGNSAPNLGLRNLLFGRVRLEFDRLAVGRRPVGFGPSRLARKKRCRFGDPLPRYEAFEGRNPMIIIM